MRTADRLPLLHIPMVGEVFSELGIDVLGQDLSVTKSKKRYCLINVRIN